LPGASAAAASQRTPLQIEQIPHEHGLAIEQVEVTAAEPPAAVTIMPSAPPCGTSIAATIVKEVFSTPGDVPRGMPVTGSPE